MQKNIIGIITGIYLFSVILTVFLVFPDVVEARFTPLAAKTDTSSYAASLDQEYQFLQTLPGQAETFSRIRLVPIGPTPTFSIPIGCEISANLAYEMNLFELINAEREKRNLQTLTWNDDLAKAARKHSIDMACRGFFSHTNPDNLTFADRVSDAGYDYYGVGENIYAGDEVFNSPYRAFRAWFYSTDHFVIMTHPSLTEVGIGYIYSPGSRYGGYFTADFASPE